MKIAIDGQEVNIPPRGPAGPDGNPIGTIISFMGGTAPEDYLVCDGAQYSISQYPALASFFQTQFGTKNHFGGDGTTTFAVPDMRNLFLRGYHGGAEEQLSGEIGVKQEATTHPTIFSGDSGIWGFYPFTVTNKDKELGSPIGRVKGASNSGTATAECPGYTARPVNMAVLYCIKAVESFGGGEPAGEVYSTEETRIGIWIDGKPIYRKTVVLNQNYPTFTQIELGIGIDTPISISGASKLNDGVYSLPLNYDDNYRAMFFNTGIRVQRSSENDASIPAHITIMYTKTTD